ncbi:MAG: MBOAT family protein, partial [Lachnospiraceae bacterium]|nr:MBOAT family protein [Candidatus Equihabitans merdae]
MFYQVTPKRFRWITLLIESYLFFILISKFLLIYLLAVTALTYLVGRWIGRLQDKCTEQLASADKSQKSEIKKKSKKEQKRVLVLAIILLLAGIFFYKYQYFFLFNLDKLTHFTGGYDWSTFERGAVPIGISFYTLEAIGYMTDVYWGKISGKQPLGKIALFLAFFPQIMEGPIALYNQTSEDLWSGRSLSYNNLRDGAIRITWGLFKKYLVADRLAPLVTELYNNYAAYHGVMIVVAAVAYTTQLYMEFSGSMDMIIGTGQMFGVTLPENFNQPFFSGNASEFWRRWHITLGIWFKTYIFYPVSTSGLVKKWRKFGNKHFGNKAFGKYLTKLGISAICLLPVWLCNGLWHGPAWNYIFYGIYYFIVILAGLALDPVRDMVIKKTGADPQALYWRVPQILKTWVIIFVGELLFRANGLKAALV